MLDEHNHSGAAAQMALGLLAQRVESLHGDFAEMRSVLKDLTEAVTKLALVEERQAQAAQAQERMFKALEKEQDRREALERRVATLERAEPLQRQTSKWVMAMVWGAAGLFGVFMLEVVKKKLLGWN